MLFFPVDVSIALTGVVHFFNNIFKLLLVGKNADKSVFIKFGIPAIIFAFIGSYLLIHITDSNPLIQYELWGKTTSIYPVKLLIAILLLIFGTMELLPFFENMSFNKKHLPIGGALSGFFGGLSGNQGALRSAFLSKAGLTKEAFIGTAVVVSAFVDFTRISVYSGRLMEIDWQEKLPLVIFATLSAMLGAFLGNKLLKKVTMKFLQTMVAILLLFVAIGLGIGLL